MNPVARLTASQVSSFWKRVDMRDLFGCWPYAGATDHSGYGTVHRVVDGESVTFGAHRLAWSLTNDRRTPRGEVRHLCDIRSCCNPAHLVVGTHAENMADMARRGRASKAGANPLTPHELERVRTLLAKGWGATRIARELDRDRACVLSHARRMRAAS